LNGKSSKNTDEKWNRLGKIRAISLLNNINKKGAGKVEKGPRPEIEEGYVSRSLKKLGGFCGSLYRDSVCSLGNCYSGATKRLEKRGGYKIALAAVPIGVGAYLASFGIEDPVFSELLNNIGFGSMGAGTVSFAEEYLNGSQRLREKKHEENEMRKLQRELGDYKKEFASQLEISRQLKKLAKQLLKEEQKQTEILVGKDSKKGLNAA
jgi:hypothetical protein